MAESLARGLTFASLLHPQREHSRTNLGGDSMNIRQLVLSTFALTAVGLPGAALAQHTEVQTRTQVESDHMVTGPDVTTRQRDRTLEQQQQAGLLRQTARID